MSLKKNIAVARPVSSLYSFNLDDSDELAIDEDEISFKFPDEQDAKKWIDIGNNAVKRLPAQELSGKVVNITRDELGIELTLKLDQKTTHPEIVALVQTARSWLLAVRYEKHEEVAQGIIEALKKKHPLTGIQQHLYERYQYEYGKNKFASAAVYLKLMSFIEPDDMYLRYCLMQTFIKGKRYGLAKKEAQLALKLSSGNELRFLFRCEEVKLSLFHTGARTNREAFRIMQFFKKFLEEPPFPVDSKIRLHLFEFVLKRNIDALVAHRKLKFLFSSTFLILNKSAELFQKGDEEALAIHKKWTTTLVKLLAQFQASPIEESKKIFQQLDPTLMTDEGWYFIGTAINNHSHAGIVDDISRMVSFIPELLPNKDVVLNEFAILASNYHEGITRPLYEQLIMVDKPEYFFNYAQYLLSIGNSKEAIPIFNQGLVIVATDPLTQWLQLGRLVAVVLTGDELPKSEVKKLVALSTELSADKNEEVASKARELLPFVSGLLGDSSAVSLLDRVGYIWLGKRVRETTFQLPQEELIFQYESKSESSLENLMLEHGYQVNMILNQQFKYQGNAGGSHRPKSQLFFGNNDIALTVDRDEHAGEKTFKAFYKGFYIGTFDQCFTYIPRKQDKGYYYNKKKLPYISGQLPRGYF